MTKYRFRRIGRSSKEQAKFLEEFYTKIFNEREGLYFEDLLNDANNPKYWKKR